MGIASIGSMSGGAVWAFQVYGNSTGDIRLMINPRDCFLAGVNYWEGNPNKKVQKVFANGPNSIYLGLIQLFYIKHSEKTNEKLLKKAISVLALAQSWRGYFEHQLAKLY